MLLPLKGPRSKGHRLMERVRSGCGLNQKERESHPLLDGRPLRLLCGPERIESGWWDASLVERDYFIAQAGDGALVWIYRARVPKSNCGWFLHGRFG
jgi:protein ImuB